jgi:hypothetical protein
VRYFIGGMAVEKRGNPNYYLGAVITGFVHSSVVLCLATVSLLQRQQQDDHLGPAEQFLLWFSATYFVNDTYVVTEIRPDAWFLLHHVAVLISYFFFAVFGVGARIFSTLAIVGELTNPVQTIREVMTQFVRMEWSVPNAVLRQMDWFFTYFFVGVSLLGIPGVMILLQNEGVFAKLAEDGSPLFTQVVYSSAGAVFVGRLAWSVGLVKQLGGPKPGERLKIPRDVPQ